MGTTHLRLDKFISNATDFSRSQVKLLVRSGRVKVEGTTAHDPGLTIGDNAVVSVDEHPVGRPMARYFMLHKPAGVVSATRDSKHPTALDLLDEPRPDQLQIAGRLDIDTTGLLLITDDGQWNHRVTSPRSQCLKTYRVVVAEPLDSGIIGKFAHGLWLAGEKRRCLPATLELIDNTEALLTIGEGKYHQVKRMFASLGNNVIGLHRLRIGGIALDADLDPGEYRALTKAEIASVNALD
ncbi:pseudouridine synthase [Porticoccus sp.]|uniref:pseudouridine synthase n=1 Tax=Porticoccus sp. TaxID=2024853 RepID=UPI003F69AF8E